MNSLLFQSASHALSSLTGGPPVTERLPQYGDYYYYDYSNIGYSDSGTGIHAAQICSKRHLAFCLLFPCVNSNPPN